LTREKINGRQEREGKTLEWKNEIIEMIYLINGCVPTS
jgi:hypothetical protein